MGEGAWDFNENIPTYGIKVLSNEQYNSYHHETVFPDGYIILTYSQYLLTHPLYTSAPPPPPRICGIYALRQRLNFNGSLIFQDC